MRKRTRSMWLIGSLAGLLLVLGEAVRGFTTRPLVLHQHLPDGAEYRLVALTAGTQHRAVLGSPWEQLLDFVLGAPRHNFRSRGAAKFDHPALGFWSRDRDRDSRDPGGSLWMVDAHGCWFEREVPDGQRTLQRARNVTAHFTGVYPRRGGPLRLAWLPSDTRQTVVSPPLRNPSMGHFPHLDPEPFPIRRSLGDDVVVIPGPWQPQPSPINPAQLGLAYEVLRSGKRTTDWSVVGTRIKDATGNLLRRSGFSELFHPSSLLFSGLCHREAAWIVAADFVRSARSSLPPDAIWTTPPVPLSRTFSRLKPVPTWVSPSGTISLIELGRSPRLPKWRPPPASLAVADAPGGPAMMVRLSLQPAPAMYPPVWARLVGAVDDRGRSLAVKHDGWPRWSSGILNEGADGRPEWAAHCVYHCEDPGPGRTVSVTFAVDRLRSVEFRSAPPSHPAALAPRIR